MIALKSECLLFELANGESVPCSAEMITVEIVGEARSLLDADTLRHAAASVFHYFKNELDREIVTIGEFSQALEKVLTHLGFTISQGDGSPASAPTDLRRLAREAGDNWELLFFPRLRAELRGQLSHSPPVVRFNGLRSCVKQMTGAQRWSGRCEQLQDQIIAYLRECLNAETEPPKCALLVQ